MTKEQAIQWIKEIQNAQFDRYDNKIFSQIPRSCIARDKWDDPMFAYGMEYGAILALMKIFDIKKDELI